MANQEELQIVVRLRDFATAEFRKLTGVIAGFGRLGLNAFRGITGAVFSLKGALAGLGVAFTVKGIHDLIRATANEADEIRDLSIALGVSTEALSELKFAAKQTGAEFQELEVGIKTLQRNLGEVLATGTGEAVKALEALGGNLVQIVRDGAPLERVLVEISRGFKDLSDQERVFVASKLFGRSGSRLIPLLSEDLEKLMATARRFGLSLSREATDAADAFNDAMGELSGSLKGLRNSVILPLLPELTKLVNAITEGLVDKRPQIIGFFADLTETIGQLGTIAGKTLGGIAESVLAIQKVIATARLGLAARDLGIAEKHLAGINAQITSIEQGISSGLFDKRKLADQELKEARENVEALTNELVELATLSQKAGSLSSGDFERAAKEAADRIRELTTAAKDFNKNFPNQGPLQEDVAKVRELTNTWEDFLKTRAEAKRIFAEQPVTDAERMKHLREATLGARDAFKLLAEESKNFGAIANRAILGVEDALANNVSGALVSIIDGSKSAKEAFHDMAKGIIADIANIIIQETIHLTIRTAIRALGGYAKGAAFQGGKEVAFAGGGVVTGPTFFPMAGGRRGLMGEAGPEAIMPLKRTPSGRLGVETTGGGNSITNNVTVNVVSRNEDPKKDAEYIASVVLQRMNTSIQFRKGMAA